MDTYDNDSQEEEEEMEIGYISTDDEEELRVNIFESRFKDEQPLEFDKKIALIEQKQLNSEAWHDDVLQEVLYQSPGPVSKNQQSTPITNLEDIQVKEKVARRWKEFNKAIADDGNNDKDNFLIKNKEKKKKSCDKIVVKPYSPIFFSLKIRQDIYSNSGKII